MDFENKERPQHPKSNTNIIGVLTSSWIVKIFKTRKKRELDENDLYATLDNYKSLPLGEELQKIWNMEKNNAFKMNRKPSLLRAMLKMFGMKYIIHGIIYAIDPLVIRIIYTLLIGLLLSCYETDITKKTNSDNLILYTFSIIICVCSSKIILNFAITKIQHCELQMKVSCSSIIFNKALRLNHASFEDTTIGKIVNILSHDISQFEMTLKYIQMLWIGPTQVIIITYLMWLQIGVSSCFGVATLLLFLPLQGWFGKKISETRSKIANRTDERIRLMNEIISGIQVIKMFSWEKYFRNTMKLIRRKELQHVKELLCFKVLSYSMKTIQIKIQVFIIILLYVLLGHDISIQKIYVIISFYNLLELSVTFFNIGMEKLSELLIAIKRIQTFLLSEEKDETPYIAPNENPENLNKCALVISNVNAKWTQNQKVNTLENINLSIEPGRFVAVIGPVGSGKSSLLKVILREVSFIEGGISIDGIVSYASQEPWIFAGSIEKNIIFNSIMDEKRYNQVVEICALKTDFKQFPYGDKTFVGERGVTLSGGQKARINLARAIYKKADIYLLDDPLSAVDTVVAKCLLEKCIKGFLKDKTRILITHQIQHLTEVDQIVIMENAKIIHDGTYQELRTSDFDLTKLSVPLEVTNDESDIVDNSEKEIGFNTAKSHRTSTENILSSVDKNNVIGNDEIPNQESETQSYKKSSQNVHISYFKSGGNICEIFLFFFMFIFTQILITGGDYWINFWINRENNHFPNKQPILSEMDNSTTIVNNSSNFLTYLSLTRNSCVIVYVIIIFSMISAIFIRSMTFVNVCMNASINLYNRVFDSIIRGTMSFFNTNSSGLILNRFSKDVGSIDVALPELLLRFLLIFITFLENIVIVGLLRFHLIISPLATGVIFYYLGKFCMPTCQNLKRLEGSTKSPILTHLNTCIQGLTTIRACNAEKILSKEFDKYQDLHTSASHLLISSTRAFNLWLDLVGFSYTSIILISFLFIADNITYKGNIGLAITQTIAFSITMGWGIVMLTELENEMISVEKVVDLSKIKKEENLDKTPPNNWPNRGHIVFQNFNLRYSPNTTPVLKNINIKIQSMEKVGVVGRTGAGKTSILSSLLRLAHNEGNIIIDDIEIHDLSLDVLRSKFSVIPQEPVLFSGTLRTNLDPFDEYPDHVLWNALENVELKVMVENLPDGLNIQISECGGNFSVGQRQLICLARAVVRNNKILILDEATANVDQQTDELIQNAIRYKFQNCTVLTIAHRLNTVIDSDKVLVLDTGTVVEFDHPFNLLSNKNGYFYKMVEQLGLNATSMLNAVAAKNAKNIS